MLSALRVASRWTLTAFVATMVAGGPAATAAGAGPALVLLVQRAPPEEMPAAGLRPLADYIASLTGRRCRIDLPLNFPAYWEAVRHHHYDMAFDAPYFADYRARKLGFTVLLKTRETASYSLIVRNTAPARDPSWLAGKRVASLGLLGVGTLRLNALFPNPVRQPVLVVVHSTEAGVNAVLSGKVAGAFLPTSGIGRRVPRRGIAVVLTTEPVARFVLSASPQLTPALRDKIRAGLLEAHTTEAGRTMLRALGFERFEPASAGEFANQRYVLKGYWGY